MSDAPYLTGQFLLAMPGIGDPRFERAVIAVCAHDDEGAVGVGVGAEIGGLSFRDLLAQLDIDGAGAPDAPVHFGGPVEMRRGFVLHSRDWSGQDTIDVAGRWSLTGTIDVLKAIAEGRGPTRWVAALGYAGWGPGQLDGELRRPGWLNVPGDETLLFATTAAERWSGAMAGAGVDPRLLHSGTGTA
ncbi:MAG: YqgE/AlgH family protein [Pseudomonadota bacterium]